MRIDPKADGVAASAGTAPLDRYGRGLRDLRISVIDRCNFRCPYCMPAERFGGAAAFLPRRDWLAPAAIEQLARAFVALGVRKLRLTGGEPLLRPELPEIIARLSAIDGVEDIALTSNGALLADQAAALRAAGLQRITVSLDALDPASFQRMSGGYGDVAGVLAGIEAARAAGFAGIKVNAMIQRGCNEDQVLPLAEHFRGSPIVLRFIEYMDVGSCNGWRRDQVVTAAEIRTVISAQHPLCALPATVEGEVARRYAYQDGGGEIGFVGSVSEPFCGDCNRARISADGRLYTCLFASTGTDLRPWLDQPGSLLQNLSSLWRERSDRYSEQRAESERQARSRIEMFRMGG
ncbi:MAG: GTP 3',8-cyclase MoaA [Lysobacterales bacterium]